MQSTWRQDYPHLEFKACWTLDAEVNRLIGECVGIIDVMRNVPIDPKLQKELRRVSFQRGAQATTAIEGNTLTDEEVRKVLDGQELSKSREYQAQEVKNALEAMIYVWRIVVRDGQQDLVSPQLICEMNRLIGQNLGMLYDGIPGKFRRDRRHVGRYLAPPPEHVPELIDGLCDWLRKQFGYERGTQPMHLAIVEAIVAHVYFEWIHPFADGNGRTGRLLEFFILLRGGLPDVAAHVPANHYNQSRTEYAGHFDTARKMRDLSGFIRYAVQGLLDGLKAASQDIQADLWRIVWRSHVFEVFSETEYHKKSVFKRRRKLALAMPPQPQTADELLTISPELLREYFKMDRRTLVSDLRFLVDLDLVEEQQEKFCPKMSRLSSHYAGCALTDEAKEQAERALVS